MDGFTLTTIADIDEFEEFWKVEEELGCTYPKYPQTSEGGWLIKMGSLSLARSYFPNGGKVGGEYDLELTFSETQRGVETDLGDEQTVVEFEAVSNGRKEYADGSRYQRFKLLDTETGDQQGMTEIHLQELPEDVSFDFIEGRGDECYLTVRFEVHPDVFDEVSESS